MNWIPAFVGAAAALSLRELLRLVTDCFGSTADVARWGEPLAVVGLATGMFLFPARPRSGGQRRWASAAWGTGVFVGACAFLALGLPSWAGDREVGSPRLVLEWLIFAATVGASAIAHGRLLAGAAMLPAIAADRDRSAAGPALLGAACALLLDSWILGPALGARAPLLVAGLADCVAGLLAVVASPGPPPTSVNDRMPPSVRWDLGLVAWAAVGASGGILFVAWERGMSILAGGTPESVTAAESAVLASAGAGWMMARRLRRFTPHIFALAALVAALALALAAPRIAWGLAPSLANYLSALSASARGSISVLVLACALVSGLAALASGAALAALSRASPPRNGWIAALLGFGAASAVSSAVLLPRVGWEALFAVAGAALVAAVFVHVRASAPGRRAVAAASAATILVALVGWTAPNRPATERLLGRGFHAPVSAPGILRFQRDGERKSIALEQMGGAFALHVDGHIAATTGPDRLGRRLLGAIVSAYGPRGGRAVAVGWDLGDAGAVVSNCGAASVEYVDEEPAMAAAASAFAEAHPKAASSLFPMRHEDPVRFLRRHQGALGIVVVTGVAPWRAGEARWCAADFYAEVMAGLGDHGVFGQRLPADRMAPRDLALVLRTAASVFPHLTVWSGLPEDVLLIASRAPLEVDRAVSAARANSKIVAELAALGLGPPELLRACYVMDERGVARVGTDGDWIETWRHPLLAHSAARSFRRDSSEANAALLRNARMSDPVAGLPDRAEVHTGLARAYSARRMWSDAEREAKRAVSMRRTDPEAHLVLANVFMAFGSWAEARESFRRALETRPDSEDALWGLANACKQIEDWQGATAALQALTRPNAKNATLWNELGVTRRAAGDLAGARSALETAVALLPGYGKFRYNLGLVLEQQGDREKAAAEYRHCVDGSALAPDEIRTLAAERLRSIREAEPILRLPSAHATAARGRVVGLGP